jgi:hypothetical protein
MMMKKIKYIYSLMGIISILLVYYTCQSKNITAHKPDSYIIWTFGEENILIKTAVFPVVSLTNIQPPKEDSIIGTIRCSLNKQDSSFMLDGKRIFLQPEIKASFPNGKSVTSFIDSLQKTQGYPEQETIEWFCYLGFIVNEEGIIQKPGLVRENSRLYIDASLDILDKMPKWNPAVHKGKKVASFNTLRVKFNVK